MFPPAQRDILVQVMQSHSRAGMTDFYPYASIDENHGKNIVWCDNAEGLELARREMDGVVGIYNIKGIQS